MLENLHLIRPVWLLALIPLGWLAWQACRPRAADNPWQRIVDARLLPLLMIAPTETGKRSVLALVGLGWLIATLALADPTWERKPQPVFQTQAARVVVLDLSSSMNATDLKPSRLARARYKVEDVLALGAEGQTGLVVYAGDAYTVTPLTRDVNTIRSQLAALGPELMPSDGSRADLGLLKAAELLHQAGVSGGQVLLIADGIAPDALAATQRAAAQLKHEGERVSVLGIGAAQAAPSSAGRSAATPDAQAPSTPAMSATDLRSVAQAGGGADLSLATGMDGLRSWVDARRPSQGAAAQTSDATAQAWAEKGPLLVLLLLPIAALAFRRNWLLSLMLLPLLSMQPHEARASTWDNFWLRPEQQAARSLNAGDYAKAAQLASDAQRRGSAEYKRGDYSQALENFAHATGPQADYNRGNALAKLGRYPDAITSYDQALKADPGNADARANKAAVEALLKQQDRQSQNQQKQGQQSKTPNSGQSQSGSGEGAKQGAAGQGSGQGSAQSGKPGSDKGASAEAQDHQGSPGQKGHDGKEGQPSAATAQPPKQGNGAGSEAENTGGSGQPGMAKTPATNQAGTGHDFADAARQLAKPAADASQGEQPVGPAPGQLQSAAKAKPGTAGSSDSAQPLPTEEQLAAEQWLRRIPDDPGGLLRRKFLYQYRQRAQQASGDTP